MKLEIIVGCKRLYNKKFLEDVMVILDDKNDTTGLSTLQNLRFISPPFLILQSIGTN